MNQIPNPFETILERLDEIEKRLIESGKVFPPEIIDRKELMKRLNLTEPTIIRWEKRGKIPFFKIGSAVRYNWISVVKHLENE